MVTETATAENAPTTAENAEKKKRNRQPSAFRPAHRITIALHGAIAAASEVTSTAIGAALQEYFGEHEFAVRIASRTRKPRATKAGATAKPAKATKAPPVSSTMIYVAAKEFNFATVQDRGIRVDADTTKLLKVAAEKLGLDPNNPDTLKTLIESLAKSAAAAS